MGEVWGIESDRLFKGPILRNDQTKKIRKKIMRLHLYMISRPQNTQNINITTFLEIGGNMDYDIKQDIGQNPTITNKVII